MLLLHGVVADASVMAVAPADLLLLFLLLSLLLLHCCCWCCCCCFVAVVLLVLLPHCLFGSGYVVDSTPMYCCC